MANPTSIDGQPAILAVPSAQAEQVTLNPDRQYSVQHTGKQADGDTDVNDVYLSTSSAVDPDASEGADKYIIASGNDPVTLPPGIAVLKFQSGGTPTIKIMPGPRLCGRW